MSCVMRVARPWVNIVKGRGRGTSNIGVSSNVIKLRGLGAMASQSLRLRLPFSPGSAPSPDPSGAETAWRARHGGAAPQPGRPAVVASDMVSAAG